MQGTSVVSRVSLSKSTGGRGRNRLLNMAPQKKKVQNTSDRAIKGGEQVGEGGETWGVSQKKISTIKLI